MHQSWLEIAAPFGALGDHWTGDPALGPLAEAVAGVAALGDHIGRGRLSAILFGFTSMHDLCIQQTDAEILA
jgi:hypothetical protein